MKELNLMLIDLALYLTDDLRKPEYRGNPNSLAGHCYVACEVLFHLYKNSQTPLFPHFIRHEGLPHWFLKTKSGSIVDPTVSQFKKRPMHSNGVRKGFLTKKPSKRAQKVLDKIKTHEIPYR